MARGNRNFQPEHPPRRVASKRNDDKAEKKQKKKHYHDIVALHFGLFLDQFLTIHFQAGKKEEEKMTK